MSDEQPKVTFSRTEALIPLAEDAREINRALVETVAKVIGPHSAAADALKRADEHGGPVRFWYSAATGTLSVELLQDKKH